MSKRPASTAAAGASKRQNTGAPLSRRQEKKAASEKKKKEADAVKEAAKLHRDTIKQYNATFHFDDEPVKLDRMELFNKLKSDGILDMKKRPSEEADTPEAKLFNGQVAQYTTEYRQRMARWEDRIKNKNRHALVIGQHHYTESDELPEAEEDANEVAMALEKMGYYVHGPKEGLLARVDLKDVDAIKTAFEHFLHGARKMKIKHLLVYYSGHASSGTVLKSVTVGKLKHKIRRPVSQLTALDEKDYSLDFEKLFADALMDQEDVQLGIILDGCRDHDAVKKGNSPPKQTNEAGGVRSPPNGFIAFACQPGAGANGRSTHTDGLSEYTHKLLKYLSKEIDINELFRRVCGEVYEATKGRSSIETWYHESIKSADVGYSLHPAWKSAWTLRQAEQAAVAKQAVEAKAEEEAAKDAIKAAAAEVDEDEKKESDSMKQD